MLSTDPENPTTSQVNPIPLLDDSPEIKSPSLSEAPTTFISDPKEAENETGLSDLCRFKFLRNTLFFTSLHLFTIVGLAYAFKTATMPFNLSHFNYLFGQDNYFSFSLVICVALGCFHKIARWPVINFALLGIFTVFTAQYIGVEGVWVNLTSARLDPTACLCFPIQVLCLALYIKLQKKTEIGYSDYIIPMTISMIISSIIIRQSSSGIESFGRFLLVMGGVYIQMLYLTLVTVIKNRNKAKMDIGDYVQGIMTFSLSVYGIQAILILVKLVYIGKL